MGKLLSKQFHSTTPSYTESTTISKPSTISSVNPHSNNFLNRRISSFSIKSSSKWSLTSFPKNTPPSNGVLTITTPNTPGTPVTVRNVFIDSFDLVESPSEYKYVDGRRFHNIESAKYNFPNDYTEMDRLKTQHTLLRHIFQSNFSSPVEEILKIGGTEVLDLGCGPGAWLLEVAETFPKSNFTGVDLTNTLTGNDALQSDGSQNVKFIKGNVLGGLPFKDSTFDYVFIRHLSFGFTEQDWKDVINEILRLTKPGGWIELMEPELKARNDGPITTQLNDAFLKDLESRNICVNITTKLEQLLMDTKQINQVFHEEKSINRGSWAGRFGEMACEDFMIIARTIKPRLSPIIGKSDEEYDQMLQNIPDEMNQYKSSITNHRFWVQKLFPI